MKLFVNMVLRQTQSSNSHVPFRRGAAKAVYDADAGLTDITYHRLEPEYLWRHS